MNLISVASERGQRQKDNGGKKQPSTHDDDTADFVWLEKFEVARQLMERKQSTSGQLLRLQKNQNTDY